MDGANRHPRPQRLHGRSLRGTRMVGRGRGQARLVIRLMSAPPLAERLVCECSSLFEHPPLMMETIARKSPHRFRRAFFHSIFHSARVWFLGGLVFCRIAVAVVVVCVEPRGPVISIGVLYIQMTAVMRREFGTAEPPSSEVELGRGRGRANGLVHVHFLPPVGRALFDKNIQKASEAVFFSFFPRSC